MEVQLTRYARVWMAGKAAQRRIQNWSISFVHCKSVNKCLKKGRHHRQHTQRLVVVLNAFLFYPLFLLLVGACTAFRGYSRLTGVA